MPAKSLEKLTFTFYLLAIHVSHLRCQAQGFRADASQLKVKVSVSHSTPPGARYVRPRSAPFQVPHRALISALTFSDDSGRD
ncbi:hypothetical protein RRG08_036047 [Elysia crispata]|uniref:Uncharacterized protein n=1 Tax=Elysia crispata TaxID=231223 RepID=A0AAE1AKT3_9GAST|nr:hypothetical protein RRG08_036047 [Elysia crispata]